MAGPEAGGKRGCGWRAHRQTWYADGQSWDECGHFDRRRGRDRPADGAGRWFSLARSRHVWDRILRHFRAIMNSTWISQSPYTAVEMRSDVLPLGPLTAMSPLPLFPCGELTIKGQCLPCGCCRLGSDNVGWQKQACHECNERFHHVVICVDGSLNECEDCF